MEVAQLSIVFMLAFVECHHMEWLSKDSRLDECRLACHARTLVHTEEVHIFLTAEVYGIAVCRSDREDRDKRDEEDRDNSLPSKYIGNIEVTKRDNDGAEETEDRARVIRTPYKQLPSVQKDIIQFCAIPRTAKEIMDHIGYYNNSKNMTTYVRPLLEMGYLEMTEPDKPQSKNQKYRKVRKD